MWCVNMTIRTIFLAVMLCLIFQVHGREYHQKIEIDIANGTDQSDCLNVLEKKRIPCRTLEYLFKKVTNNSIDINDTEVIVQGGTYNLSFVARFKFLRNVRIISSKSAVINCISYDFGINFSLSKNITIDGIIIQNCGVKYNPDVVYSIDIFTRIGVNFQYCKNIMIVDSIFINNLGIAVGMVDVIGTVEVLNSKFINNTDKGILKKGEYASGGGLYIGLSGFNWEYDKSNENNTYFKITGSQFRNNTSENNYDIIFPTVTLQDEETYFGKGAGINIDIFGGSYSILINNCEFLFNSALWGGAIYASFNGSGDNSVLHIENSSFLHNNATLGGGGIRLDKYASYEQNSKRNGNTITLHQLDFIENHAIWGGGLSVSLTTEIDYREKTRNRNITISNCRFLRNSATVGFALGADTLNKNIHSVGATTYRLIISHSKFEKNVMTLTEDKKVTGQGAIYAEEVSVILIGNNSFSNNTYTALCLDSSKLTFTKSSKSIFDSNEGIQGGAISLYGFSWILLEENCHIIFQNNVAKGRGGAIYVRNSGPPRIAFQTTKLQISTCFIRYQDDTNPEEWPVSIIFRNNSAPASSGNSIYATSLKYCRKPGEQRNESSAFRWKPIRYYDNVKGYYEVVTDPMYVTVHQRQWNAIPDLPFNGNVSLYDEKEQNVYGTLKLEVAGAEIDPPNNVFLVRKNIKRLRLLGKVHSNYSFRFFTLSGMALETPKYTASFGSCKPGFEPDINNTKCVCMSEESSSVVRCFDNGTVFILKGKWGYINSDNKLDTIDCPAHFCKCHHEYEGYLCKFDSHSQCANNRTGTLCSLCPVGMSVTFGNEACAKCSNIWLLLILPGMLIFSIFCAFIFYLNIDVFSGHLNAYLYCYQMIDLLIPDNISLDPFIRFIIGITSLGGTGGNLGFCLYDGMNNLDKLMINYAIPFYVVICTLLFGLWIPQKLWEKLFCCKTMQEESETEQKQARNHSFGRALSFVLVLCYSSFTTVTLKLLHPVHYNDRYVVYNAGFQDFLKGRHLIYSIIAILILIFVVIGFPIILLFTHYFSKRFYMVQKAEPIFNALKSNFQDNMICRCFAAFYFICRLILLVIDIFIREEVLRLIILAIASVIIQAFFSAVQPYKKKHFNYWDILQLADMCLISLLSLILSVPFTPSGKYRKSLGVLLQIFVYIPLISAIIRLFLLCYYKENDYDRLNDTSESGGRFKRWRNHFSYRGNFPTITVPERLTRDFDSEYN